MSATEPPTRPAAGAPTAHALCGRPARPPAALQTPTDNRRQRAKQYWPLGGPVINEVDYLTDGCVCVEIAMFTESPSNNERTEPRLTFKPDPKPFSTFKPSKSIQHKSAHNIQEMATSASQRRSDGGRFSFDSLMPKRPLPPIPKKVVNPRSEDVDSGLYKKQKNASIDLLRWQSRVSKTKSKPLTRAGSEPNLLEEADGREQRLSSSQSLEFLDMADEVDSGTENSQSKSAVKFTFLSLPRHCRPPQASSVVANDNQDHPRPASCTRTVTSSEDGKVADAGAPPLRSPPPAKPPMPPEDGAGSSRVTTRTSLLRRQRPVSIDMRRRSATYQPSHTPQLNTPEHPQATAQDINPAPPVRRVTLSSWLTFVNYTIMSLQKK